MEQPVKLAVPAVVVAEQPERTPGPEWIVKAMVLVSVATVLFPASWMVTAGCVTNGLPPMALLACVVNVMCVGSPPLTLNAALVALVSCPSVAESLYPFPTVLIAQPLNVKAPLLSPVDVHVDSVPGPPVVGVPAAIPMVTVEWSVGTGSPAASSTVTTGWAENAVPPLAPLGWVENTNLLAGPEIPLTAMPTMDLLRGRPPVEPSKAESP